MEKLKVSILSSTWGYKGTKLTKLNSASNFVADNIIQQINEKISLVLISEMAIPNDASIGLKNTTCYHIPNEQRTTECFLEAEYSFE